MNIQPSEVFKLLNSFFVYQLFIFQVNTNVVLTILFSKISLAIFFDTGCSCKHGRYR